MIKAQLVDDFAKGVKFPTWNPMWIALKTVDLQKRMQDPEIAPEEEEELRQKSTISMGYLLIKNLAEGNEERIEEMKKQISVRKTIEEKIPLAESLFAMVYSQFAYQTWTVHPHNVLDAEAFREFIQLFPAETVLPGEDELIAAVRQKNLPSSPGSRQSLVSQYVDQKMHWFLV